MERTAPSALPSAPAVLELLKPVTWFAPMWAFACGIVGSGVPVEQHLGTLAAGVLLCGPLVCGTSQAVNDWFDRHVDAINEPDRPIPSGRIPGRWGLYVACIGTLLSLAVAAALGPVVLIAACVGLVLAWAYSTPPARLKLNAWWGNAACALCYEGLPWITGAALMLGTVPPAWTFAAAGLYSLGAHGIMTTNDFKSVEGDRQMGVRTLQVQHGERAAALLACGFMALPQLAVAALLWRWEATWAALVILGLVAVQGLLMARLLGDPRGRAPWFNATGTTLYVAGMMVTAVALRGGVPG